jgi:hypothetical protein
MYTLNISGSLRLIFLFIRSNPKKLLYNILKDLKV